MGERKGQNKYYPPDYDPTKGGLNKFLGTHALRERARKLHLGILIIRFEMPYNIWCEGCGNHIGMGVRYNAEKTKIGMYYSTPVYQFKMKCHLCPSYIVMKTDPGNLDYVVTSGARRQENRWDPTQNEQIVPEDKQVGRQLASDAMFKLEHGVEDKTKLKSVTPTLAKLEGLQERWKDDYEANKLMRASFRTKKKELKSIEDKDNEFLKKSSLEIQLLPESSEDSHIASLLRLEPTKTSEERQAEKRLEIEHQSKFPTLAPSEGDLKIQMEKLHEKSQKQRSSLGISITPKNRNGTSINNGNNYSTPSSTVTSSASSSSSNSVEIITSTLESSESESRVIADTNDDDEDSDSSSAKRPKLSCDTEQIPIDNSNDNTKDSPKDNNKKSSLNLLCDYGSSTSSSDESS